MTRIGTIDREELAAALSSSVGEEKARETIAEAAEGLGFDADPLPHDDALEVLAQIAAGDGLLALTARFTRSRLMARWATESLKRRDTGRLSVSAANAVRAAAGDES